MQGHPSTFPWCGWFTARREGLGGVWGAAHRLHPPFPFGKWFLLVAELCLEEVTLTCARCRALLWTRAHVRQRGLSHGPSRSAGDAASAGNRHGYPLQPGKQQNTHIQRGCFREQEDHSDILGYCSSFHPKTEGVCKTICFNGVKPLLVKVS